MRIAISGMGSISALGSERAVIRERYGQASSRLQLEGEWIGKVPAASEAELAPFQRAYPKADRSLHLALHAAGGALRECGWAAAEAFGINFGSSRGATGIWEAYHRQWLEQSRVASSASPLTTLGNLSSLLGQHFQQEVGPTFSHSITCSTALHAVLNAAVWLQSGRCDRFLAGGTEAPLTPFTIGQMKALRLYAQAEPTDFPCRAWDFSKTGNTMVLGEGAAAFCLERDCRTPLAWLVGLGFGAERTASATGISATGKCLQRSMRGALEEAGKTQVDLVITHSPGTVRGDAAEREALRAVFGADLPPVTNNKWLLGHTLGASGALSLELGILCLQQQKRVDIPYLDPQPDLPLQHVLINAVGFGGNAVSLLLQAAGT